MITNACTRIKRTRILTYHIHWSQGHWYIHSYFMEWYVICFRASWRLNINFLKTALFMFFSIPTVSHISMSLSSNSECYQFMPFSVAVKELIFSYINQVIYNYKGFFLNYGVAGKFMGSLYLSVFYMKHMILSAMLCQYIFNTGPELLVILQASLTTRVCCLLCQAMVICVSNIIYNLIPQVQNWTTGGIARTTDL